ncbi:MAG: apolipoprotein N-acyltransferase [Deltaproteobacteria bacterium]
MIPSNRYRAAAAIGAGVLLAFALPTVFPIWGRTEILPEGQLTILAYVALVPLLWALRGTRPKGALGWGFVAGLSFFSVAIWWIQIAMHTFGGIPNLLAIPVLYLLIGYLSLYWGAACALGSYFSEALELPLWITLPPLWTALELLRSYLFSGYPWADVGYTLARDRAGVQWASLFGVYGLAFVVVFCNAALYELLFGRRRRPAAIALAAALAIPHLYGVARLRTLGRELAVAPTARVGLVQGNIDQKIKNAGVTGGPMSFGQYSDFVLSRFLPSTLRADADGMDLIAWPEASYPSELSGRPTRFPSLGIPKLHAELLLGGVTIGLAHGRRSLTNSAFALGPDLTVLGQYDKHHLVPFGEYVPLEKTLHLPIHAVVPDIGFYDPGEELNTFSFTERETVAGAGAPPPRTVRYAPLICFDAIFPEIGVEFAREDPDFLVNITNDAWYGFSSAAYQFLSMVTVRAVETGKAIARPANTGISAFVNPDGRIVSHTSIGLVDSEDDSVSSDQAVPPVLLEGRVPLLHARTPYVVIGDAFAYLCALFSAGLWLAARRRSHASR